MRRGVGAGLVLLALLARAAEGIVQLPLTMPGKPGTVGELMGPGQKTCYNLTLSDKVVKEVVWWEQAKLILRLEPCVGKPHLRPMPFSVQNFAGEASGCEFMVLARNRRFEVQGLRFKGWR